ncbi:class I SAM-dependent methyltransferase [Helicobacter sp. 11S02596-1]|uniref:class I SAM-dependent methyltransferase n=1 Tax=Helicobacter sp. 11S02596-1 TaxID=1476194 RepID=UPI000BA4F46A|nr:class I SAM-dependent methyltransferase [Helicobacter sp. 11S02596-1]PAF45198.1 methyltransferase [Helicobacter sp. 11S02596-1]
MPPLCPLCQQDHCEIEQTIHKNDLIKLYERAFKIDVGPLIASDVCYWHCKDCDLRFFTDKNGEMPTGDDDFYNALNKLPWYYMDEKNEYHQAKNFIKPQDRVLEVGCGKGAFAKFLSTPDYVGLEFSTDAKKLAQSRGIQIENISIQEYSQSHQGSFDVVCSFQVLEHVKDPRGFLSGKREALRGGGI